MSFLRFFAAGLLLAAGVLPAAGEPASLTPARRDPVRTDCSCGPGRTVPAVEPSGIIFDKDGGVDGDGEATLYLVSDSGLIARRGAQADGAVWSCLYVWCGDPKDRRAKADHDFESVALVPGQPGYLWVGTEGTTFSPPGAADAADEEIVRLPPRLRPFDLAAKRFAGAGFALEGIPFAKGSGMESLTFVPDPQNAGGRPAGYFLASSQHPEAGEGSGAFYRFPLPATPVAGLAEKALAPLGPPLWLPANGPGRVSSDVYYDPGSCTLYVAYDDESPALAFDKASGTARLAPGSQAVGAFSLQPLALLGEWALPAGRGVEGVTARSRGGKTELFVAIDMSGGQNPGRFAAGGAPPEKKVAKKKDLKALKGAPAPNTVDRYPPAVLASGAGCP